MAPNKIGRIALQEDEQVIHDTRPSWAAWWKLILFTLGLAIPYIWWERKKTRYVVTDQRVIMSSGAVSTSTNEYLIDDITNIQTEASIAEKLRGYGTIQLDTSSMHSLELEAVPNYNDVANTIRTQ